VLSCPARIFELTLKLDHGLRAVRQTGQRVVKSQPLNIVFSELAVGGVVDCAESAKGLACGVVIYLASRLHPAHCRIDIDTVFDFQWRSGQSRFPRCFKLCPILRMHAPKEGSVAIKGTGRTRTLGWLTIATEMAKTKKALPCGLGKILKSLHCPLDVILLWVRWYVAYSLSLRNLEEILAERGIEVDHSSVHRWVIKPVPLFVNAFRRPSDRWPRAGGWTRSTSRSKANGNICTALSTRKATLSISCCAPTVTRLLL
jgi:hypothetical protein